MPTGLTADELEKAIVREKARSDALTDWPDPDITSRMKMRPLLWGRGERQGKNLDSGGAVLLQYGKKERKCFYGSSSQRG